MLSRIKKVILPFILLLFFLLFTIPSFAREPGFTQKDRERLVRVETTLRIFMEQVDKRFEQVDRRFAELREDMNRRFEQVDKRFEQVDKRFDQMISFLWIIVGIFTALTTVVIGFAYWDRRTIIKRAKDEAIETIEKEGRLRDLIMALRKLASEDRKLADVLRSFGLL